jgi:acetyl esterase/lipase
MNCRLLYALISFIPLQIVTAVEPERIPLWKDQPAQATVTLFRPERPTGAAMIICPGGAYVNLVTGGEGNGVAQWLNRHGITGIVLEYRLPNGNSEWPLLDAQRAIRLVRSKAAAWKVDPTRVGIIGFSAGGHLASTAATHFDTGNAKAVPRLESFSCRPDFAVLVYPVISMGKLGHAGSRDALLGPNPTPEKVAFYSTDTKVSAKTPPTFLVHAKDDTLVSPENSQLFAAALKVHRIPHEYFESPDGGHGFNNQQGPSWDAWQARCLKWLGAQGMLKRR